MRIIRRYSARPALLVALVVVTIQLTAIIIARALPVPLDTTRLSAGEEHTCLIVDSGELKCWGRNNEGQLGDGTSESRSIPVAVVGLSSGVSAVSAGFRHTCAVLTDGSVRCWGSNSQGQLGDGTFDSSLVPVAVPGISNAAEVSASNGEFTCVLLQNGSVKCWGSNSWGQLGDGTTMESTAPVDVVGITDAVDIAAGGGYVCAVLGSGGVRCWGNNFSGQLGDGTHTNRSTPVDVDGITTARSVANGGGHTCVIVESAGGGTGPTSPTGPNPTGPNPTGPTSPNPTGPTPTGPTGTGPSGATGGTGQTSGGIRCLGWNQDGQLGNGSTTDSLTPVDVSGLGYGVTQISSFGNFVCAIDGGDGAQCWGTNAGRLGDGTSNNRSVPGYVSGLESGVEQLAVGVLHACALMTSGGVKCWGFNDEGQLGDGSTNPRSTPVDVLFNASRPSPPTSVAAEPLDQQVRVTWQPPNNDGGSAITGYTVSSSDGRTFPVGPNAFVFTVTGLTNGTPYTFSVVAHNVPGGSDPASAGPVTPFGRPGKVPGVTVEYGDGTVKLTWPAADANGESIDEYVIKGTSPGSPDVDDSVGGSTFEVTFNSMLRCVPYSFTVTAVNDAGAGLADPVTDVTAAALRTVVVKDTQYNPSNLNSSSLIPPTQQCLRVKFAFDASLDNTKKHSVTDFKKIGVSNQSPYLYDSGVVSPGGPPFTYLFQGAAYFTYRPIATGAVGTYTGGVGLPVVVTPSTGAVGTQFDISLGRRPATWLVFDVEYSFMKQGKNTWSNWTKWRTGVTSTNLAFTPLAEFPKNGPGKYRFRAFLRNPTTNRSSDPSADLTVSYITVS